jgi:hypothetical protein
VLLHLYHTVQTDEPPIPLTHLAPEYVTLLNAQNLLGPDSIFFGLFVSHWPPLQDRYLLSQNLRRDKQQAASGIQALLGTVLQQVHTVWLLRNEHLHGTDPFHHRSYKRLHLLAQIRELYNAAPLMLASDRDILSVSFDYRYSQTTASLHTFYAWAKPIVDKSTHDANDFGSHFRRIDSYFRPSIPPELFDVILITT